MANDKHVAMLRKGVAAWNAWRDENLDFRPNLSDAALPADLAGAHLSEAELTGRTSSERISAGRTVRRC